MDKAWLVAKIKAIFSERLSGSGFLEVRNFGRTQVPSVWVELQALQTVAESLKQDSDLKLDWLENMSIVEFEDVFIANYFLRSFSTPHQLVLRVSAVPKSHVEVLAESRNSKPRSQVKGKVGILNLPSVTRIWPMVRSLENEAQEMFGIQFEGQESDPGFSNRILPEDWNGFPLRKEYQFPTEVYGIRHTSSISGRDA